MIFWAAYLTTLLFYQFLRIWFMAWNHKAWLGTSFSDLCLVFAHGFRFDLFTVTAAAIVPGLLWVALSLKWDRQWLRQTFLASFFMIQAPLMLMSLGDTEFMNFTGRRFTFDSLQNLREMTTGNTAGIFTQYWLPTAMVFLTLGVYFYILFFPLRRRISFSESFSLARRGLGFLISLVLLVIAVRGGVQPKPISYAHAQIFQLPFLNQAVMNSGFTFLQSANRDSIPRYSFMPEEEMLALMDHQDSDADLLAELRPSSQHWPAQNVVVIILESFSFEHMGHSGGKSWTPFLDELADRSLFFENAYANARRSIEGITAITAGIPALMDEPFVSSSFFASTRMNALGQIVEQTKGQVVAPAAGQVAGPSPAPNYHTSFFHGGNNGTMFFDEFTKAAGLDHYYGAKEYPDPKDHDGSWGIYDEPFLKWTSENFTRFPKPFASVIFTLSSHHPFTVPEKYKDSIPKGPSEIHQALGYSDLALKNFFAIAEKQDWYKNTLFVITADHTFKIYRPEFNNELGHFRVPILFFHPQWNVAQLRQRIDTHAVVQHIDILPSVIDFLGFGGAAPTAPATNAGTSAIPQIRLGKSIFRSGPRSVIAGIAGRSYFIREALYSARSADGVEQVFSMQDLEMKSPLPLTDVESIRHLQRHRAYLQYYSQGLWQNKLYR